MKKSIIRTIAEFFAIVIGILGAFSLEEWSDQKDRNSLIKEVMHSIIDDLEEDLKDLKRDRDWHRNSLTSNTRIILAIETKKSFEERFCYDFYYLEAEEYSPPSMSGYNRLLNLNVESAVPDSLYSKLSHIYTTLFARITKPTTLYPDIHEYLSPYYRKHFKVNDNTSIKSEIVLDGDTLRFPQPVAEGPDTLWRRRGYQPLDYEKLINDPEYFVLINNTLEFRIHKFNRYNQLVGRIEDVLEDLNQIYK